MLRINKYVVFMALICLSLLFVRGDLSADSSKAVDTCDTKVISHIETIIDVEVGEYCEVVNYNVKCDTKSAMVNISDSTCYLDRTDCYERNYYTNRDIQINETICILGTERIEYKSEKIEYIKENLGCSIDGDYIICDERGDGNGDGICQSGETCYKYKVNPTRFDLVEKKNGDAIITSEVKPTMTFISEK